MLKKKNMDGFENRITPARLSMLEVLMTWIKVNEIRTEQTPGD
jgi:hypothetical protein